MDSELQTTDEVFFFFFRKRQKASSKMSLSILVTTKLLKHITRILSVKFKGQLYITSILKGYLSCVDKVFCNLVSDFYLKAFFCSVKTYVYAL